MRNINKVILVGFVTREAELRQTGSGQNVAAFTIATNRSWMTSDGRKMNDSQYHDVVAWAKIAELASKYLKKGKLVHVEGYLKTRSWDTPEGIKKFKTEVIIDNLIMLEKREMDDRNDDEEEMMDNLNEMPRQQRKPIPAETLSEEKIPATSSSQLSLSIDSII